MQMTLANSKVDLTINKGKYVNNTSQREELQKQCSFEYFIQNGHS